MENNEICKACKAAESCIESCVVGSKVCVDNLIKNKQYENNSITPTIKWEKEKLSEIRINAEQFEQLKQGKTLEINGYLVGMDLSDQEDYSEELVWPKGTGE